MALLTETSGAVKKQTQGQNFRSISPNHTQTWAAKGAAAGAVNRKCRLRRVSAELRCPSPHCCRLRPLSFHPQYNLAKWMPYALPNSGTSFSETSMTKPVPFREPWELLQGREGQGVSCLPTSQLCCSGDHFKESCRLGTPDDALLASSVPVLCPSEEEDRAEDVLSESCVSENLDLRRLPGRPDKGNG